ncbi:hypothetical protein [Flavobacterium sp.]|uniref:hypothetical protein n=1 Tax=Flavobacterium sp. TaxID=239 RepID=UPI002B4ADD32|nr:hypothetical protein [Flavobacterium sp.]HLF52608.1 hypothetical protein [Flavobacterium sp.]
MKKIIFLLILIPFTVLAKYNPGSITFNDGTTKNGFIEIPKYKDIKIKFKSEENGKTEKFKIEDVKGFQIQNEKNTTDNYTTIIVGNNKIFNPTKFNLDDKKSFVKIVKQGKISVYLIHFEGNSAGGSNGKMRNSYYEGDSYYLQRENDDFAFAIGIHRSDLNFMTGFNLYMVVEMNFKDICPNFVELLKKEELKATEFYKIVEIYEQNCGGN